MSKQKYPTVEVENGKKTLKLVWNENHTSSHNCKWIRFHCHCDRCWRPFSGMYPVDKTKFGSDFSYTNAKIADGNLFVNFNGDIFDDHETKISLEWLLQHCNCRQCLNKEFERREVQFSLPEKVKIPIMNIKDLSTKEGLFKCIEHVMKVGFCIVNDVPQIDREVERFAKQFGYIQGTAYGMLFDVKIKKDPYNTQNTAIKQVLHQDLPWYEVEPGVQYLHALQFDQEVEGGESVVVDLYMAAHKLKADFPQYFDALTRIPACFETKDFKRDMPAFYETRKPHIELDVNGRIVAMHWNPGVEGVLRVNEDDVGIYYEAYNEFLKILRTEKLQYVHRLQPGQVLIFNNHRMVHSRNGFVSNNGVRHLQGVYTNLDDMKSKYMVLANELNIDAIPIKVCNKSSF